ncbi:alpha-tocopherol transfer protein-like isoform X2 [Amblyomma americanum]
MSGVYTKRCVDDVLDTSEGALPLKLQRIAEEELGETPAKRRDALQKLAELLQEEEDLDARRDSQFLLRFLRVRKYNLEAALRNVCNYYRIRTTSGPVFDNFLPSKVSEATRKLVMALPGKDIHGRRIFLFKPGSWMPDQSPYADVQRATVLCLEHLAKDPATQTLGIVMMFDYAGLTPDKILSMNVGLMRRGFEYLQECIPIRLKAMYAVRHGAAFDVFFAITKPFMKAKIIQRVRLFGERFEELHKEIPPQVLPAEYGGHGPPLDFDGFWSDLVNCEEAEYQEDNAYGYVRTSNGDFATTEEMENEATFL